ncbi:TPA: helix-turn-helix transcriptional regulator [Streptococcus equi subsp. zooepidemicus]|nr:helix-turn-helix transcriptional regulator [Streptococcus equi subsp. zooepidemicus]HEL0616461.1 helix-turn-helix transcriptional regulator [Streptococcus equi subsp. zooepidemicus]HEL0662032.1 helix-turn-helix transcriptional regulator [Streptococcus equi subsp. zooepidemicus]HEL0703729.1 helix-turn-helix transcriptional regulator [Streptococcus equi subsp. zooepidemicus]HEL0816820.1 helix-turn-helix transcriptional regulator [Streptococcus equi subsp. zooepidemicus]
MMYNRNMESKNFDYQKLKAVLDEQGVTIEQLAKAIKKEKRTVASWLKGTNTPHKSSLDRILKSLNISERRISKDGVVFFEIAEENQQRAEVLLYNVLLPFFAYYEANQLGHETIKEQKAFNNSGGYNGKNIQFIKPDFTKPSLINEMTDIIKSIKQFTKRSDFPLKRMKNYAYGFLEDFARDITYIPSDSGERGSFFQNRVETVPDDVLKSEYARRLLNELDEYARKDSLMSWQREGYPSLKITADYNILEFTKKFPALLDAELFQICADILNEDKYGLYSFTIRRMLNDSLIILNSILFGE